MDSEENTSEERITADNDIALYSICPYAFYLNRLEGRTKTPWTAKSAQAMLFFAKIKNLFDVRDPKAGVLFEGQRRAGPGLTHIEKMTPEQLKQYIPFASADSFGGSLKGIWFKVTENSTFYNIPVHWSYPNERFKIASNLKKAGTNYYNFIINQGVPVMGLVEKQRTFMFEGQHFRVKIPEIRVRNENGYSILLDNISLSCFRGESANSRRTPVKDSALATLKLAGLSRLIRKYPETYLPKLNAPFEFWEFLESDKSLLLQNLLFRHVNLLDNTIETTARTDADLDALRRLIDSYNEGLARENFAPNTNACDSCRHNTLGIDGNPVCKYRNRKTLPYVPSHYFTKANFRIEESEDSLVSLVEKHGTALIGGQRKDIATSREIGRCGFAVEELADLLKVKSRYKSEIFGIAYGKETFETAMISRIDETMQKLADKRRKNVSNAVDFNDFDYAGKTKAKEKLEQLGYKQAENTFEKMYAPMVVKDAGDMRA